MHIVCRTKQEIDETGRQCIPTLEQHSDCWGWHTIVTILLKQN